MKDKYSLQSLATIIPAKIVKKYNIDPSVLFALRMDGKAMTIVYATNIRRTVILQKRYDYYNTYW